MIIDTHIHFFDDKIAVRALEKLEATASIKCRTNMTESDTRLKLEQWGIDLGVVLPIATKPSQQRTINDWARRVQGGKLLCFGTVHPYADNAIEELSRIRELGLYGVKLHPDYQQFYADDKACYPVYEEISRLNLPLCLHCGYDPVSPDDIHAPAQSIIKIHKDFPKLKIIAAHLGSMGNIDEAEKIIAGHNIYVDISMSPLFANADQLGRIIKKHGAERVLFASDCPWSSPLEELALLDAAGLSEKDRRLILYKNAAELLKIPASVIGP